MSFTNIRVIITAIIIVFVRCECNKKNLNDEILLVAILPIYEAEGFDCTKINLRGLQQSAVLQKTLQSINNDFEENERIKIDLRIFDSCDASNNPEQLFSKIQDILRQPCPPLFFGFIAPGEPNLLHDISENFPDTIKVLPFASDFSEALSYNTFRVGKSHDSDRAKVLLSVVNNVKWESVLIILERRTESIIGHLQHFLNITNKQLCVPTILKYPTDQSMMAQFYESINEAYKKSEIDGIVVLADTGNFITRLHQTMEKYFIDENYVEEIPPVIIYSNQIGMNTRHLSMNISTVFIQEISNEYKADDLIEYQNLTLRAEFEKQLQKMSTNIQERAQDTPSSLKELVDSSTVGLEYALILYSNAIKAAYHENCKNKGMCVKLMNISSYDAVLYFTATIDQYNLNPGSLPDFNVLVNIYTVNQSSGELQLVGPINENKILSTNLKMPPLKNRIQPLPEHCTERTPPEIFLTVETYPKDEYTVAAIHMDNFFWDKDIKQISPGFILVGFLLFVLFFLCCIKRCVYNFFKEDDDSIKNRKARLRYQQKKRRAAKNRDSSSVESI